MRFTKWIIQCMRIVSYSIVINGKPSIPFQAKKGLRQSDPISPYLFGIAMEYFTRLMPNLRKNLDFNYHPKCAKVKLIELGVRR